MKNKIMAVSTSPASRPVSPIVLMSAPLDTISSGLDVFPAPIQTRYINYNPVGRDGHSISSPVLNDLKKFRQFILRIPAMLAAIVSTSDFKDVMKKAQETKNESKFYNELQEFENLTSEKKIDILTQAHITLAQLNNTEALDTAYTILQRNRGVQNPNESAINSLETKPTLPTVDMPVPKKNLVKRMASRMKHAIGAIKHAISKKASERDKVASIVKDSVKPSLREQRNAVSPKKPQHNQVSPIAGDSKPTDGSAEPTGLRPSTPPTGPSTSVSASANPTPDRQGIRASGHKTGQAFERIVYSGTTPDGDPVIV